MTSRRRDKLETDLSAYLDGELSDERSSEITALLAHDAEARALCQHLQDVTAAVRSLPPVSTPRDLSATLEHRAERFMHARQPAPPSAGSRVLRLALQVSAAAAVLLLCVLIGYEALDDTDATSLHARRTLPLSSGGGPPPADQPRVADRSQTEPRSFVRGPAPPARRAAEPAAAAKSPAAPTVASAEPSPRTQTSLAERHEQIARWLQSLGYASPQSEPAAPATATTPPAPTPAAPRIRIQIFAASEADYVETAAVLNDWQTDALAPVTRVGVAAGFGSPPYFSTNVDAKQPPPVTGEYLLADAEIEERLEALVAVNDRKLVRVATAFNADNADVMLRAMQALRPSPVPVMAGRGRGPVATTLPATPEESASLERAWSALRPGEQMPGWLRERTASAADDTVADDSPMADDVALNTLDPLWQWAFPFLPGLEQFELSSAQANAATQPADERFVRLHVMLVPPPTVLFDTQELHDGEPAAAPSKER